MNDKKTIEETIIEDIQKTGYPTEITAASIMQANGWSVVHTPSFWDQEEQKSREIDIQAYRQWPTQSKNWTMGVYLIAECKKSEKPWVFFYNRRKIGIYFGNIHYFIYGFLNSKTCSCLIRDWLLNDFRSTFTERIHRADNSNPQSVNSSTNLSPTATGKPLTIESPITISEWQPGFKTRTH